MDDLMLLVSIIAVVAMLIFIVIGFAKKNKSYFKKAVLSLIVGVIAFAGFALTVDDSEVGGETKEPEVEVEVEEVELTTEEKIKTVANEVFGDELIDFEYMEASERYFIYANTAGLSANMDRKSAYFSATDFLEKIKDEDFDSVYLEYQAVFVDDFGNEEERKGIAYDVTKETVDKINFDSFLPDKLPDIVDSYWQHPAFD